jgi:hypothetical protein
MTNNFQEFAEKLRTELERGLKAELSKTLLGGIVFRAFMPLTVNINTNQGIASLTILHNGAVQLDQKLSSNPDTVVHADFEALQEIYRGRDRAQFTRAEADGRIKIISCTSKGQQAERKLRELLRGE